MKIIGLQLENVKRLSAVEVALDGTLQVIGGKNGAGKSSVMDAVWLAIGGKLATRQTETSKPVREGADGAVARVDLGDLIVTRTWKADGSSTVKVTTADGAAYKSPQGILDALTANVGIDPLAFTQLDDRKQVEALLGLVALPFDPVKLDEERQRKYDQRADSNRLVVQYRERLRGYAPAPEGLPENELALSDLLEAYTAAQDLQREQAEKSLAAQNLREAAHRGEQEAAELEARAREIRVRSSKQVEEAYEWEAGIHPEAEVAETVAAAKNELDNVEATNRAVRNEQQRKQGLAALEDQQGVSDAFTREIKALDERKQDALAAAEFPGGLPLGFADGKVTLNGVPFKQASAAEQIRTSIAMGMALNPKLRTLFIRDGSLLDADNMALIGDMARDADFQVLVERVGDSDEGAIIIEDGQVRA